VTASNLVGQAETSANLNMAQIPPSFGRPIDRAIEVDEGDILDIKTKLDGSPVPKVKWWVQNVVCFHCLDMLEQNITIISPV
jgi:hypothetical protein